MRRLVLTTITVAQLLASGCESTPQPREDGAVQIPVSEPGSLQNPAFSPDGGTVLFTVFRDGYNTEPADILLVELESGSIHTLVSDGWGNINLPGSSWNADAELITFSSTRDPHDEIYVTDEWSSTGDEWRVTDREDLVAYEPTFSPNGERLVFESHPIDVEEEGVITVVEVEGPQEYLALTDPGDDCRQPNWSPSGDLILYQRLDGGVWDIWVMDPGGSNQHKVTDGQGDSTDASFSPDGDWIVFSSDAGLETANLFAIPVEGGSPVRVTEHDGYDGAPSWSPDGKIAFESSPGDPDESDGTSLWIIDVPDL